MLAGLILNACGVVNILVCPNKYKIYGIGYFFVIFGQGKRSKACWALFYNILSITYMSRQLKCILFILQQKITIDASDRLFLTNIDA